MAGAVNIAVVGAGLVGKEFLRQLAAFNTRSSTLKLNVISVQRSAKGVRSKDFSPLTNFNENEDALTMDDLAAWLKTSPSPVIVVDNTSSEFVAASYPSFLQQGIAIATPNKKAFSGPLDLFEAIARGPGLCYHESSVGAGLPIISTLNDLVLTGDKIHKIEGIFSGTLSYIFNEFSSRDQPFSSVVKVAKELGYTEPDPRDDLNGMDVARKLTILARLSGLMVKPNSFPIHSLIPDGLQSCKSGDEFVAGLPQYDADMDALKKSADGEGKVLRFVGSLDTRSGEVKVSLEKVAKTHPFASLQGSDNVVAFTSERYPQNPLIVQGAGAGAAVTAMGVLADVIKIAQRLA
ncbi:Homoserine dehydrogenase [Savitreella phatthalungensis]